MIITGKIHEDEFSILNIYALNTKAPRYVKEALLKPKLDIKSHTQIVEDFNTPLSSMNRFVRSQLYREIRE